MSVTATPGVSIGGVEVATGGPGETLYAVDSLSIGWGRDSVFDQPKPSTAAFTLLDLSQRATFARRADLIGQYTQLSYAVAGQVRVNFRGWITDVEVTPRRGGGFLLRFAASSTLVELGNVTVPEGTVWPAESFQARRERLRALIPAGLITGGITLPGLTDIGMPPAFAPGQELVEAPAAAQDVGGKSLLQLLEQLFASTSVLPMVHDPHTDALTFSRRRRYTGAGYAVTPSAQLVTDADRGGRWVPASLTGLHLDAGLLGYSGPLTQALDSRLTSVGVSYYDQANGWAQASTSHVANVDSSGHRAMTVDTVHGDPARAAAVAWMYADLADREGRAPRLSAVEFSSGREPFPTAAHADLLLAGVERESAVFLAGSWLPRLAARPLVGVVGGTIAYSSGEWTVALTPAPVEVDPYPFPRWGPVTVAAAASSAAVRLRDLDPSFTFGDAAFVDVGAGYTPLTQPAYRGNPT